MKRHIFYMAVMAGVVISASVSSFSSHASDEGMQSATATEATAAKATVTELTPDDPAPIAVDKPVVIDFYANWCGPCKNYKPVFDRVADEYGKKATFVRVDIEKCRDLAEQYRITTIPTTIILTPDGHAYKDVGAISEEQLRADIDIALKQPT